jgi:proteasome lid subunit RPN8/RPN11
VSDVRYTFYLVPIDVNGQQSGPFVELDESVFAPAIDWTNLDGIRKNVLPPFTAPSGFTLVPRWSETLGEPVVDGFVVQILGEDSAVAFSGTIPLMYFEQHAKSFTRSDNGSTSQGISLFRIHAAREDSGVCDSADSTFTLEKIKRPLDIRDTSFDNLLHASTCSSGTQQDTSPGIDFPVFITEEAIDRAVQVSKASGKTESGGILAGYLCRDSHADQASDIFAVITEQIHAPVESENARETSIRFTPATWSHLRGALRDRNKGEMILSWYHSHPFLKSICGNVTECKDATCSRSVFFSSADIQFHRIAFSSAWSTALVIGDAPCSGFNYGLYGWRRGMVVKRDFYILRRSASEMNNLLHQEGNNASE